MSDNLVKLEAFVDGHIAIAAGKSPEDAAEHLERWAAWLDGQFDQLASGAPQYEGLTALDLANARDRLMSAAPEREAA